MAKHQSHSIEFKRQVAQAFISGETLHALSRRHDVSRKLIRIRHGGRDISLPSCRDPVSIPRQSRGL
jgi:transposase-like protein